MMMVLVLINNVQISRNLLIVHVKQHLVLVHMVMEQFVQISKLHVEDIQLINVILQVQVRIVFGLVVLVEMLHAQMLIIVLAIILTVNVIHLLVLAL